MIARLLRLWRDLRAFWVHDVLKRDEWKPCGVRYTFTGHDQELGEAARLKALKLAKLARKVADRRSQKDQAADVLPMRRAK